MAERSRDRVLAAVRAAPGGAGVREIADAVGLHPNTARFHLDALVAHGLAERAAESPDGPGRPRAVYRADAAAVPADLRRYRLLADLLTGLVAAALPDPARAAADAGTAWGRRLADGEDAPTADAALRRLGRVLAETGFAPAPPEHRPHPVIPLRHCPFREPAEAHGDVVCALHLGMIRGILSATHAPLTVTRLEPWAGPSLCLAHFEGE